MLGLSIDKLLVVAIVAALIIGPARLPGYAQRLGEIVRGLRSFLDAARARAEVETGLSKEDWESMDPRRYDPRRIVREALAEPEPEPKPEADAAVASMAPAPAAPEPDARAVPDAIPGAAVALDPGPAEPGSAPTPAVRYIITGSSAHPRRVLVSASAPPPASDGERESAVELA